MRGYNKAKRSVNMLALFARLTVCVVLESCIDRVSGVGSKGRIDIVP